MGDFGALVSVRRTDDKDLTSQEIEAFKALSQTVKEELNLTGSMGTAYAYHVGTTQTTEGAIRAVNILLSDYHGDHQDFKWHETIEEKNVQIVALNIASKIEPTLYEVTGSFEWW